MQVVLRDVRHGLRLLRGNPGFTAIAVLTLALGISVNTTVFSWVNRVLITPVPGIGDSSRLVYVETFTLGQEPISNMSWRDYLDFRRDLKLVSGIAVAKHAVLTAGPDDRPERLWGEVVSGNYFSLLQVPMRAGRGFRTEEGEKATPVAVISYRLWRANFGLDPGVVGKSIRINRHNMTIVGVAPPEFLGGTPGLVYDVWIPFPMQPALGIGGSLTYRPTRDCTATFARLAPGVTIDQARQEIGALARRLAAAEPLTNAGIEATALPLARGHNGAQSLGRSLVMLLAVGAVILLVVSTNLSNLLLARTLGRQHEFGVRLAVGAGRSDVIRQVLTETLMLAVAGTGAGILLSLWMRNSLERLLPSHDLPVSLAGSLDTTVFAFTAAICVVVTMLAAIAPAILSIRSDLTHSLKQGGRGGAGAGAGTQRVRNTLIVCEIALASVALIGAVLFVRSFRNAGSIQPGFDTRNVLVSRFYLSPLGYSAEQEAQFCRNLRDRLAGAPGVEEASYADQTQLTLGRHPEHKLDIEGYAPGNGEDMYVRRTLVGTGYLHLLRIPVLEGRDFTDQDTRTSLPVMIVNQTFARRFFGDTHAIGRRVRIERRWHTIIGVAKDSKYNRPTEPRTAYFYLKYDQFFSTGLPTMMYVKTKANPIDFIPTLRREVLAVSPEAANFYAAALEDLTSVSVFPQKFAAALISFMGFVALALAAVGVYGVMSFAVSRRTQEFGVRSAFGASPVQILRMIVGDGLRMALAGVALGGLLAAIISPGISGMLVGVSATDPVAYGTAAALLVGIAVVACIVPAHRAARVDPMVALRSE